MNLLLHDNCAEGHPGSSSDLTASHAAVRSCEVNLGARLLVVHHWPYTTVLDQYGASLTYEISRAVGQMGGSGFSFSTTIDTVEVTADSYYRGA
jgi:hypothetical protein